jgi:hypothetical protein
MGWVCTTPRRTSIYKIKIKNGTVAGVVEDTKIVSSN